MQFRPRGKLADNNTAFCPFVVSGYQPKFRSAGEQNSSVNNTLSTIFIIAVNLTNSKKSLTIVPFKTMNRHIYYTNIFICYIIHTFFLNANFYIVKNKRIKI